MGKKLKKKARSGHKDKRVAANSPNTAHEDQNPTDEQVTDAESVVKERKGCAHLIKSMDLTRVSSKLELAEDFRCEDCREGVVDRKAAKGKGKHGKKKGTDSKAIWVCLECGHFACGGVGLPTTHQSHAVRHARQSRHPLVIQVENPHLRWCFSCSTLIPLDRLEENGEQKDVLSGVVKLIKKQPPEGASVDVEDVWFGSGSVVSDVKSESSSLTDTKGQDFYTVRGLTNLGNTCFFNSVLQNLLAMDRLQECLLKLDCSTGPLTNSLKKMYVEIHAESGARNVLNPKSLFGCVCSKAPQFRGYQQQDSHELLRYLLDGLSTEDLRAKKLNNSCPEDEKSSNVSPSFVDAIFGGQISSTVCCVECGHSSVVYEPFLDLSLPVPTRKSSPRKGKMVSRTSKIKPPPRKVGKARPKHGMNRISAPVLDDPKPPTEDSYGSQPSAATAEGRGDSLAGSSLVCPTGCDVLLHSNGSLSQNGGVSASLESKGGKDVSDAANQAASLDDSTWMDYLDPMSVAAEEDLNFLRDEQDSARIDITHDGAINKDVGTCSNQSVLHNGKDFPDAAQQTVSLDESTCMDFLEPMSMADKQDLASECDEASASRDSERTDAPQNDALYQNVDTCSDQVLLHQQGGVNVKSDSFGYSFEDEAPLQVGDSEILLLPYKEETVVGDFSERDIEPSSSAVGDGEDFMGFDGFADMFNEPEVSFGPNIEPSAGASDDIENGFLAGNSSESNPDEVDTDSPVSIESCLSHFTKPEFLAEEQAWHCENCTKIMLEEKRKSRKCKLKSVSPIEIGCDDNFSSYEAREININNGQLSNDGNNSSEEFNKPVADQTTKKASETAEDCESGESDQDETDSKSVKMMRDATKRILISKLPPILTIHLKRFSQDARGRLSKLNGHIFFKEVIDLRPYMDFRCPATQGECKYRLVGLVEHLGSMRGGHYVAYVRGGDMRRGEVEEGRRNPRSVWYYASDAHVCETNLEEVLKCEAYILFYERV